MSHETVHPFGEADIVRLLDKKMSRRTMFLYGGLLATLPLVTGSLSEAIFDVFPHLTQNLVLNATEEEQIYTTLLGKKTGMGWYLDFDTKGDAAFDDLMDIPTSPESSQLGVFALLEEFYQSDVMETHVRRLRLMRQQGYIPQISLGVGSYFKPHPFAVDNANEQVELMKKWTDYLLIHTVGEIHIRFLYEVNVYAGDIAYKKPSSMTDGEHQERFKRLYEAFASIITENIDAKSRFHLDLCFAASGRSIKNYFPQANIRAVGVDIYPEPYGRLAILSLYDWLFDKAPTSILQNKILIDLLTESKSFYGQDTKAVLHEIGTTDDHLDWFKSALLLFLAANGEEIMYFCYDKTVSEKMNYALTAKKRAILRSFHL